MTRDLCDWSLVEAAAGLRQGSVSPVEAEAACAERRHRVEPTLHAFLVETPQRSTAPAVAAALARGEELSPLAGLPIAIKDNLCVTGAPTTAGSRSLEGFVPARDATVVRRLTEARANLVGKTNLDEFGMGSSTEHSAYGPTRHPIDPTRVPGGSSGGSAAAVAAGAAFAALGTDTGGSIRQPAAFCGLVGLKPTYGRVSRAGLIALTSSTDVVGVLARTAADAACVFAAIAGPDPDDATTVAAVAAPSAALRPLALAPLKIGVVEESFTDVAPEVVRVVRAQLAALQRAGAQVEPCSLPASPSGLWVYYIITPAEASTNLARYDGLRYGPPLSGAEPTIAARYATTRGALFGDEVKRRILLGTFALSQGYQDRYYAEATRVRAVLRAELARALKDFDCLAMPTTPDVAFALGAKRDPLSMYREDVNLVGASLAGLPAVSVPAGLVQGLPVGLHLIGRPFEEERLLALAAAVEAQRGPLAVTALAGAKNVE